MGINIAIDGTAGSGKGSVSEQLAKRLGFFHLDTGAIYRSVAYAAIEQKISPNDEKKLEKMLKNISFSVKLEKVGENHVQKNILNGEDLKEKIRTEEISEASSIVSQFKEVREFATSIQHKIANKYDVIIAVLKKLSTTINFRPVKTDTSLYSDRYIFCYLLSTFNSWFFIL